MVTMIRSVVETDVRASSSEGEPPLSVGNPICQIAGAAQRFVNAEVAVMDAYPL